ncbi:hypothetical protein KAF25_011014 [Fusarium avenaceum]|uniref:Uncharacterized protein n=1 Tax=Fusarium avenaceum TaxID=40199 RepID=A0A9P7GRM1_9HYPO|nr:hypothetical protein KAF25_011014 [Fusarium avenaceum]
MAVNAKIEYLNKTFDIPKSHMFSSRDDSFATDLLRETGGKGVDVALNSISGDLLYATWTYVAKWGTMVEIGKRDPLENARLDMSPFLQNLVQVGRRGDVGIIEIQDIMFTVNGATAGAVVVEWNAREATQGSAGLWDSHIRVGGAAGSDLQYTNCPKLSGSVNPKCKAASTLFHLTPGSSAYLENAWNWVADHDLDRRNRDQVDVYVARGMLIESDLAYLWVPKPFEASVGLFANDPTFKECKDDRCRMSLAVRILDSTAVYILGTGLYSWFYNHKQDCVKTQNCQTKGFEVEESYALWVYNLCTRAIVEMVSPRNSTPIYARDNVNGFLSSILAWRQGSKEVAGKRAFPGFLIHRPDDVIEFGIPESCQTALTQRVLCDWDVSDFTQPKYRESLESKSKTDLICDTGYRESLRSWFNTVELACRGYTLGGAVPMLWAGYMWAGYNETCLKDSSGKYCNDVISKFISVSDYTKMPREEMCSTCYVKRLAMMQASPYSIYDDYYERQFQYICTKFGLKGNTTVPNSLTPELEDISLDCGTDECAAYHQLLFIVNQYRLPNCSADAVIGPGTKLCMPAKCDRVHQLRTEEDCHLLESNTTNKLLEGDVQLYNKPVVGYNCINLQDFTAAYGNIIYFGPEFEQNNTSSNSTDTTTPQPFNPYTYDKIAPPTGAKVP